MTLATPRHHRGWSSTFKTVILSLILPPFTAYCGSKLISDVLRRRFSGFESRSPMLRNAGLSGQSPRKVHDALPLAPAVLDRSRIQCKQFRGITPLHGCRVWKSVALISPGGAAAAKSLGENCHLWQLNIIGLRSSVGGEFVFGTVHLVPLCGELMSVSSANSLKANLAPLVMF